MSKVDATIAKLSSRINAIEQRFADKVHHTVPEYLELLRLFITQKFIPATTVATTVADGEQSAAPTATTTPAHFIVRIEGVQIGLNHPDNANIGKYIEHVSMNNSIEKKNITNFEFGYSLDTFPAAARAHFIELKLPLEKATTVKLTIIFSPLVERKYRMPVVLQNLLQLPSIEASRYDITTALLSYIVANSLIQDRDRKHIKCNEVRISW